MIYPAFVMLIIMGIVVMWGVATNQESKSPAAAATPPAYACDAGTALLYPDGPQSTPICVAFTPARKL